MCLNTMPCTRAGKKGFGIGIGCVKNRQGIVMKM
jgi:hypothetical protein